ncbi:MAG: hypothetical protein MJ252_17515 [archaeon]|nr:hypothetical protein [archaeon]
MDAQQSNQNHQAYQPQIPLENLDQDNQMMTDNFNKCIADYKSIFGQMDNIFMEVWDNTDEVRILILFLIFLFFRLIMISS